MKKRNILSLIISFSLFIFLFSAGCGGDEIEYEYEYGNDICTDQYGNIISGAVTVNLTGASAYEGQNVIFFIYAQGFAGQGTAYGIEGGGNFTITSGAGQSVCHGMTTVEPIIYDLCNYDFLMWIDADNDQKPTTGEMISVKEQVDMTQVSNRTITFNISEFYAMPASEK